MYHKCIIINNSCFLQILRVFYALTAAPIVKQHKKEDVHKSRPLNFYTIVASAHSPIAVLRILQWQNQFSVLTERLCAKSKLHQTSLAYAAAESVSGINANQILFTPKNRLDTQEIATPVWNDASVSQ